MIKCNKCGETKSLEEFSKDKSNKKTGRQRSCKSCQSIRWVEQKDPEKERWRHILRKYNLTKEQWEELFARQGNCCAICQTRDPGSTYGWHTDHDHETGEVRGILCMGCNRGIGFLNSPIALQSAAAYLARQSEPHPHIPDKKVKTGG